MKIYRQIKHSRALAIFASTLFMCFLFSCEEEIKPIEGFSVDKTVFSFSETGGTGEVEISSGEAWTAATNVEWCMISPANGHGSAICEIVVDTSYLYSEREAIVTFYSGSKAHEVNISQLGYNKEILVKSQPESLPHFEFVGKNHFEVTILSNVAFELHIPETDQEWLEADGFKFTPESTPRAQVIKFTYQSNTAFEDRVSKVKLVAVGDNAQDVEPVELLITQNAAPFIPKNSRQGDSMALLSMSAQLNQYISYDPSQPMESWVDVHTEEVTFSNDKGELVTDLRVTGLRFFLFNTDATIPFEVTYLTELKKLVFLGNSNAYMKEIVLGPEVTELEKLEHLELYGYGVSELCPEISQMSNLKSLVLDANSFLDVPMDIFLQMPNLEQLSFGNNRRIEGITDLSNVTDDEIGVTGELPKELFMRSYMPNLKHLALFHNYFEGPIPDVPQDEVIEFESLKINGNMLSGEAPSWVLTHRYLPCWDAYTFIFNQSGYDSKGNAAYFSNEPNRISGECELWDEDEDDGDIDYNPDWGLLEKYGVDKELYFRAMSSSLSCK